MTDFDGDPGLTDQIDQMWRDDRLVEALARREPVVDDDPALGALLALTRVGDAPLPDGAVDASGVVDQARHRRYAVRSLAAAVTAVATLSTSGVAAVVTGDPLQPAKAVWEQFHSYGDIARAPGADVRSGAAGTSRGYAGRDDAWTSATGSLPGGGSDVRADSHDGAPADGSLAGPDGAAGTASAPQRDAAAPAQPGRTDADPAGQDRAPGTAPRADDSADGQAEDQADDRADGDADGTDESGAQPSQPRRSDEDRDGRDSTEPTPLPEPPPEEPLLDGDASDAGDTGDTDADADGAAADEPTGTPVVPPGTPVLTTGPAEPGAQQSPGQPLANGSPVTAPLPAGETADTLDEPLKTDAVAPEARADG